MSEETQVIDSSAVTLSLKKAQNWGSKWRNMPPGQHKKTNAYLIPNESLSAVLAQGGDAVRAYIGINDAGEECLMFVGTKLDKATGVYVDMLPTGQGLDNAEEGDIYDATRPCPPNGDPGSPMLQ